MAAHFTCAVALVVPGSDGVDPTVVIREGEIHGQIILEPRGSHGFGYDPIFQPTGYQQTTAELSPEIKDEISHRGRALRAILPELSRLLGL